MCKNMFVTRSQSGWFLEPAGSIFNSISRVDISRFESKATWTDESFTTKHYHPCAYKVPPCITPKYQLCITAS